MKKQTTSSGRKEEIRRLERGLEVRKGYPPDNPVLSAIKERLKFLRRSDLK